MLGGTGGGSGAKFIVDFPIEGSGEQDLEKIARLGKAVQTIFSDNSHGGDLADGIGKGAGAMRGLGDAFRETTAFAGELSMVVMEISEALDKVHEFGLGMMEGGVAILHGWEGLLEKLMEKGGEFENMLLRIQGAGNTPEHAQKILQDTLAATARMPITEEQATR